MSDGSDEIEPTGHSRALRRRLKEAREDFGLSQTEVGRRMERYGVRKYTGAAVSLWEKFENHPPIDVMAAWARVVGLRLIVDLDEAGSGLVPVLIEPRSVEPTRQMMNLDRDAREIVEQFIQLLPHLSDEVRYIVKSDLQTYGKLAERSRSEAKKKA